MNEQQHVSKEFSGPFRDILDIATLLSTSDIPERVIETVLTQLCDRLGKRARCALLAGEGLTLRFWAGNHACPIDGLRIKENSIVMEAVRKGTPINLTDPRQSNGYNHTLDTPINVKSIIPLSYTDPMTKGKKTFGVLIVDSGREDVPISSDEFEYLQVIGQLISAIVGRAELIHRLMDTCHNQEAILMEAAHNFRNSIAIIGGFSRRIAKLARDTELAESAKELQDEVQSLEQYFDEFEKKMNLMSK